MAVAWAQGERNSGKTVHWWLSGEISLCADWTLDFSVCSFTSHDVVDVRETNPKGSSEGQKKIEENCGRKQSAGENMARRETRGCTERDGFPSSMRLDKQRLAWRAALASFLSLRFSRLWRKEKTQVAPIRALLLPSWHQQSLLMRLDWITECYRHSNVLNSGTFQNTD